MVHGHVYGRAVVVLRPSDLERGEDGWPVQRALLDQELQQTHEHLQQTTRGGERGQVG